jgi:hypothetical protein
VARFSGDNCFSLYIPHVVLILAVAAREDLALCQFDVQPSFLHAPIQEDVTIVLL